VSYADFMTLLFAFFTTMYAVSTIDSSRLTSVAAGLHDAFGVTPPEPSTAGMSVATRPSILAAGSGVVGPGTPVERGVQAPDPREAIERALDADLEANRVRLTEDRRGLVLSIPEAGAFPPGSAEMSDAARDVMTRLAAALEQLPNAVRIEGHTDDVPIHNAHFNSNWELSTARATFVVQFLLQEGGLEPDRLSAAGYGAFHPVAENASPDGRARNRRVDIVIAPPAADLSLPADGVAPALTTPPVEPNATH
jgi:chemotaxis protein MotB